jgi:hypothetical protein
MISGIIIAVLLVAALAAFAEWEEWLNLVVALGTGVAVGARLRQHDRNVGSHRDRHHRGGRCHNRGVDDASIDGEPLSQRESIAGVVNLGSAP